MGFSISGETKITAESPPEVVEAVDGFLGLKVVRSRTPEEENKIEQDAEAIKREKNEALQREHLVNLFALGKLHTKMAAHSKNIRMQEEKKIDQQKQQKKVPPPKKLEEEKKEMETKDVQQEQEKPTASYNFWNSFSQMVYQAQESAVSRFQESKYRLHNPFATKEKIRSIPDEIELDNVPGLEGSEGDDYSALSSPEYRECRSPYAKCAGKESVNDDDSHQLPPKRYNDSPSLIYHTIGGKWTNGGNF